jgi:Tol biopolymer transport system component
MASAGETGWSVDAWDRESGSLENVSILPAGKKYTSISLAPDGMNLLLVERIDNTDNISLLNMESGQDQLITIAEHKAGSRAGISAVWNASGSDLLLFTEQGGQKAVTRPLAGASAVEDVPNSLQAAVTGNSSLVPLSWSPDGAWLVYRDYADPTLPLLLQAFTGDGLQKVDPLSEGGMITLIGWMVQTP